MKQAKKKKVTRLLGDAKHPCGRSSNEGAPGLSGRPHRIFLQHCKTSFPPTLKLLFDFYHVQIMDGDLVRHVQQCAEYIGHIHPHATRSRRIRRESGNQLSGRNPPLWKSGIKDTSARSSSHARPRSRPATGGVGVRRSLLIQIHFIETKRSSTVTIVRIAPRKFRQRPEPRVCQRRKKIIQKHCCGEADKSYQAGEEEGETQSGEVTAELVKVRSQSVARSPRHRVGCPAISPRSNESAAFRSGRCLCRVGGAIRQDGEALHQRVLFRVIAVHAFHAPQRFRRRRRSNVFRCEIVTRRKAHNDVAGACRVGVRPFGRQVFRSHVCKYGAAFR